MLTTDRKLEYLFLSKVRHSPAFNSNREDLTPIFLVVTIILCNFVIDLINYDANIITFDIKTITNSIINHCIYYI